MQYFLSCDWGTSSLRLRLVDIKQKKVVLEEASGQGILDTFNLWQQTEHRGGQQKRHFYLAVIAGCISNLERRFDRSLNGVKIIISGMASSSAGFVDIPYAELPLPTDGSGIETGFIEASQLFDHDCLVISGVKTADDVMRGEETHLIGCVDPSSAPAKNSRFIFPGTHSKHIRVRDDHIASLKTYMTGEFLTCYQIKVFYEIRSKPRRWM